MNNHSIEAPWPRSAPPQYEAPRRAEEMGLNMASNDYEQTGEGPRLAPLYTLSLISLLGPTGQYNVI